MKRARCPLLFVAAGRLAPCARRAPRPADAWASRIARSTLDADKVTADQTTAKTCTSSGNVIVTQGDIKMHADSDATYDRKAASKIYRHRPCGGGFAEQSGIVSGDTGVYDVPKKLVTLTGHVVLKQARM